MDNGLCGALAGMGLWRRLIGDHDHAQTDAAAGDGVLVPRGAAGAKAGAGHARLAWVVELGPAAGFSIFIRAGVDSRAEAARQADAAGFAVAVIFNIAFRQRADGPTVDSPVCGGLAVGDHHALGRGTVFDDELEAASAGMDGGLLVDTGEIAGGPAIAVVTTGEKPASNVPEALKNNAWLSPGLHVQRPCHPYILPPGVEYRIIPCLA